MPALATGDFGMVVLNRIYTRAGDEGSTMLGNGEYRKKYDLRVDAYGTVDEVTAAIGVARLHTADAPRSTRCWRASRTTCSISPPTCARPTRARGRAARALAVNAAQVKRLEDEIDTLNAELAPLRTFVLAGGSPAAAYLHLARTICRRAERVIVELKDSGESVSAEVMSYINRLSDFLFVASRYLNDKGARDVLWVPGANR